MKFRCEREILAEALTTAGRAATNRSGTLPVLSGVRLDVADGQLTVTGTDLELTIRLSVPVHGDRDGLGGGAGASGRRHRQGAAGRAPSRSPSPTTRCRSAPGVRSSRCARCRSSDYPAQVETDAAPVTLSSQQVGEALRQVVRAASTDDARAVLTGVLWPPRTTGSRWSPPTRTGSPCAICRSRRCWPPARRCSCPGGRSPSCNACSSADAELSVRLGAREAVFEVGGTRLTTRLIEGEYPNYRNLLPSSYPNQLTVGREALLEALRRVKILAQDSTPVRLALGGDTLRLTAITQDVGNAHEEIDATYDGTEMTVAFNPDYLAAGVEAVEGDEVTLSTLDPMKPAVLRGVGHDDYLYLLMPVRVP